MKKRLLKDSLSLIYFYLHGMRLFIIFLLLCFSSMIQAQKVTGSWYGIAEASAKGANNNNYLTELIITQKGNDVEGIFGYYFRSGYQSYYVRGKYNPRTRQLVINNIPVTYFKSRDIDGIDCPMNFAATLIASKVQSTLKGAFISQDKYKYTCPQLDFSYTLDVNDNSHDSLRNNTASIKKYWKPRNEELVLNTKDIPASSPVTSVKPLAKDSATAVSAVKSDSVIAAPLNPAEEKKRIADSIKKQDLAQLRVSFDQRKTILSKEIEIESDSVRIAFYDNGDIDGDSISVFINKVPVLAHQPLSERALNMYLAMDDAHSTIDITMFAENLGIYPPNTALMIITDGAKLHEVFLSSSLTQNASVILKKRKH